MNGLYNTSRQTVLSGVQFAASVFVVDGALIVAKPQSASCVFFDTCGADDREALDFHVATTLQIEGLACVGAKPDLTGAVDCNGADVGCWKSFADGVTLPLAASALEARDTTLCTYPHVAIRCERDGLDDVSWESVLVLVELPLTASTFESRDTKAVGPNPDVTIGRCCQPPTKTIEQKRGTGSACSESGT